MHFGDHTPGSSRAAQDFVRARGKAAARHVAAVLRPGFETPGCPQGGLKRQVSGQAHRRHSREAVAKVIRKELQELRRMPYLSDLGRETAEKAERLFACINGRYSA